jgi:hypothetical protein
LLFSELRKLNGCARGTAKVSTDYILTVTCGAMNGVLPS